MIHLHNQMNKWIFIVWPSLLKPIPILCETRSNHSETHNCSQQIDTFAQHSKVQRDQGVLIMIRNNPPKREGGKMRIRAFPVSKN